MTVQVRCSVVRVSAAMLVALCVDACTAHATHNAEVLPFPDAVDVATDGLASQTQKLPSFLGKVGSTVESKVESSVDKNLVVVDPMIDGASGQQTNATHEMERRVTERLTSKYPQFSILPFQSGNLSKSKYLLVGTLTRQSSSTRVSQINLALTELASGKVVAQSSALATETGLDNDPTPYFRDSPVLTKDESVRGYVDTSQTEPGAAANTVFFQQVATDTLVAQATDAYNAGRYVEALKLYTDLQETPAGQELRVLNGVYLADYKLGRTSDAESAFGRVVAFGLASNNLGVKFLFNPGTVDFWSDAQISGPYRFWLRQIAKQTTAAKVCLSVIGHTSRSGSEEFNARLSLDRAKAIVQKLDTEAPGLTSRLRAEGRGFKENIVGTGSDDASDALDRRVEFKGFPC